MSATVSSSREMARLIANRLRSVWVYCLCGVLCTMGFSLFTVGIANVQKDIIDLMEAGQLRVLYRVLIMWGIGLSAVAAVGSVGWFLIGYGTAWANRMFRREVLSHVNELALPVVQEWHTGDLVSRIHSDTAQAVGGFLGNIAQCAMAVLTAVTAFFYLCRMHLWLTLAITAIGPLLFLLGRIFDARLRHLGAAKQENDAAIRSFLQENVQCMELVRAFGLEDWAGRRFLELRAEGRRIGLQQTLVRNLMEVANNGSSLLIVLTSSLVIALTAIRGDLTTGALVAFLILLNRLTQPFVQASSMWGGMQHAFSAAGRVDELLQLPTEQGYSVASSVESPTDSLVSTATPALEMREVSFSHGEREAVLMNLTFSIGPGEVVGLVGPSGAGKTTVARLAVGLLQPEAGEVLTCGHSTSSQLSRVRALTAYVPQVPHLFATTVWANVTCGQPQGLSAEDEERLGLRVLASQLPEGLKTQVGERGVQLSGGQRQRVALARALLRRPQLIVLDEATSALDNETEAEIAQVLAACRGNAAILMIAHRLTTVADADRILVLHDGRIAEAGTHATLLAEGGIYKELWQAAEGRSA